jgi:hypothetical protein
MNGIYRTLVVKFDLEKQTKEIFSQGTYSVSVTLQYTGILHPACEMEPIVYTCNSSVFISVIYLVSNTSRYSDRKQ